MANYPMRGPTCRSCQMNRNNTYYDNQNNAGQPSQAEGQTPQNGGQNGGQNMNRPNGILGKLFNPQDPLGSITKIVNIMKIIG